MAAGGWILTEPMVEVAEEGWSLAELSLARPLLFSPAHHGRGRERGDHSIGAFRLARGPSIRLDNPPSAVTPAGLWQIALRIPARRPAQWLAD